MLFARCISKLKRRLFPDVACKAYVEGEIIEEAEVSDPIVEAQPVEIKTEPLNQPKKLTQEQVDQLEYEFDGDEQYTKTVLAYYDADSIEDLPPEKFDFILSKVQMHKNMPKKKAEQLTL